MRTAQQLDLEAEFVYQPHLPRVLSTLAAGDLACSWREGRGLRLEVKSQRPRPAASPLSREGVAEQAVEVGTRRSSARNERGLVAPQTRGPPPPSPARPPPPGTDLGCLAHLFSPHLWDVNNTRCQLLSYEKEHPWNVGQVSNPVLSQSYGRLVVIYWFETSV